jgi:hypothetical protein
MLLEAPVLLAWWCVQSYVVSPGRSSDPFGCVILIPTQADV